MLLNQYADFRSIIRLPEGRIIAAKRKGRLWVVEDMSRLNDPMRALRILEKSYGGDLPAVASRVYLVRIECDIGADVRERRRQLLHAVGRALQRQFMRKKLSVIRSIHRSRTSPPFGQSECRNSLTARTC